MTRTKVHTRFTVISSAVLDCAAPEVDVHARRDQGMDWMSNPEHAVKKSDPEAEAEVAKLFIYVNLCVFAMLLEDPLKGHAYRAMIVY